MRENTAPQPDAEVKVAMDPRLQRARYLPIDLDDGRRLVLTNAFARRVGYAGAGELIERMIASGNIRHPEQNAWGNFNAAKLTRPIGAETLSQLDSDALLAWMMPDGTFGNFSQIAGRA